MNEILIMFGLTVLQNASFTLVSRARNSSSLLYHAIASVLSNGIWLLVIRHVVNNFENITLMLTYLVGSVTGSILMHKIAMKYFEKPKESKLKEATQKIINKETLSPPIELNLSDFNEAMDKLSKKAYLIGLPVRGFKFETTGRLSYASVFMDKYIKKEGIIKSYDCFSDAFNVDFSGDSWLYPAKLIEKHLITKELSDPINLINCNIKGFKFEPRERLQYNKEMVNYEGELGEIELFQSHNDTYRVRFEDDATWNYPSELIEKHLIK